MNSRRHKYLISGKEGLENAQEGSYLFVYAETNLASIE